MRSEVQSFDGLVAAIARAHAALAAQASQAVNISLTLSNWLIGCYIQDYEQAGADRAVYGAQLLDKVSARLAQAGMGGRCGPQLAAVPAVLPGLPPDLADTVCRIAASTDTGGRRSCV